MVKGADVPVRSFCGKAKDAVAGLVAGPRAYICNERVARCAQLLEEPPDPDPDPDAGPGPAPQGGWASDLHPDPVRAPAGRAPATGRSKGRSGHETT